MLGVKKVSVPAGQTPVATKAHRVFVIDCSGSMTYDLPQLRQELKRRLPILTQEGDIVSLIWFSGRGQYGTLVEALPVRSLTDLAELNRAIDKWLRPMGMTGFVEPLGEVVTVTKRHTLPVHLFFMTDGYENQWGKHDVLAAAGASGNDVASATIVEYGWHCNHALLVEMAEKMGASLIVSDKFAVLNEEWQRSLTKPVGGGKKVRIQIGYLPGMPDYAFSIVDKDAVTFKIENGEVLVPADLGELYVMSDQPDNVTTSTPYYAALYVAAQRMDTERVWKLLAALGDVALIKQFSTCFSAQDYADFTAAALDCVNYSEKRLSAGYNPNAVPDTNAYTLIDLLDLLAGDDQVRVYPSDPAWKYERIGAKRENASTFGQADKDTLIQALEAATGAGELLRVREMISEIVNRHEYRFVPVGGGVPIAALTYNEDRANVSIQVKIHGTVDLPSNRPEGLPEKFPTFVYRNYAVIKDGIRHGLLACLPVSMSQETFDALIDHGVLPVSEVWEAGKIFLLNANLPVVNQAMVSPKPSALTFFTNALLALKAKADAKVYGSLWRAGGGERRSAGYDIVYGVAASDWLKEVGLTDHGGFAPQTVAVEPTDEYTAPTLEIKMKGLSSLPKVADVIERRKTGSKLTPSMQLMMDALDAYDAMLASPAYAAATNKDAFVNGWLDAKKWECTMDARRVAKELAKAKFAVLVGHAWFSEFAGLNENTLTVNVNVGGASLAVECKVELGTTKVKI